jgi:arsenical pump membrane protein
VVAVPVAGLLVLLGAVTAAGARAEVVTLAPTLGFLAAVLVLAHLADTEGVFAWAGAVAARAGRGEPQRLLLMVFALAAGVTAVLSLDATVVLLTPVVLATAARVGVPARPHVYACAHLANSASLLLPVSNLTNLLAVAATGLGFAAFTGLMALPWLAAVAVEYLVFRRFFAADLARPATRPAGQAPPAPRFALAVPGLTLAGFAVCGPLGLPPVAVAVVAVLVLAPRAVRAGTAAGAGRRGAGPRAVLDLLGRANPAFLAFVAAMSVVVLAVRRSQAGDLVTALVPDRADLAGLAAAAALAALLANLVNNLPATLLLLPLVAHTPGLVLAMLLGVNIGPNLSYAGSLATLLWRQVLQHRDRAPGALRFHALGVLSVPLTLGAAVLALWAALAVSRLG